MPTSMGLKSQHIPKATIERLAVYLQVLGNLARDEVDVISSEKLAQACKVNSSQIRKDLAYFGEFGVRGVGYYVQDLRTAIKKSLGIDRTWNCALVGAGNLGRALLRHSELPRRGFRIKAVFDCDPDKIGGEASGLEVLCPSRLRTKVEELQLEIGIITTPPERAQRAADFLVEGGIKGIVSYAPTRINTPPDMPVRYVDFFHHLYAVAFQINMG